MKNRNKYFNLIIVAAVVTLVGLSACESNSNYINPKEYIEAELKLLDEYYNEEMANGLSRLDSMSAAAIDTVDHRLESGLMLYHTKIGEGDSVKVFKRVAYRFTAYDIVKDSIDGGLKTVERYLGTNDFDTAPVSFTTYIIGDAASAQQTGVSLGINEAIQHMRYGGEAKIVVPSAIAGFQGYDTYIYELRVTYLEQ
ncbi:MULTISPECIES: hypothetical protein [unclassified Carboxylicivirga]|uniref:hypothetical protein n=1 Tax=Carboxylicivirga TaxID=1628153 RepID=UPI003D344E60